MARGLSDPTIEIATAPGIEAGPETFWRAASISKVVTGQIARHVLDGGRDISEYLGWTLRHPLWPDQPITVVQVASHQAGLSDVGGYAVPMDTTVQRFVADTDCFGPHAPGTAFDYSNLGYVLLGCAIERATGETLSDLAERLIFAPNEIRAGFNWVGLTEDARAARLPTYRRDANGAFMPQIDAVVTAQDVPAPSALGAAQRLSPQGGLRISLMGALRLARSLRDVPRDVLWAPDMGYMETYDGAFERYGWGLQIYDDPVFYPRPLIGHFANAYGFVGGVWYDAARDVAFVMALNGRPVGEESDGFLPEEMQLFQHVATWAGQVP